MGDIPVLTVRCRVLVSDLPVLKVPTRQVLVGGLPVKQY